MSKHGEPTALLGKGLKIEGYDVFYDHDIPGDHVGNIVSTFGEAYGREEALSQLDIAIVRQGSRKTIVLCEIEETSDRPKTLLGDIFGVLFGEHVFFKRKELEIGDFTTLIVAGVSRSEHTKRNQHIQESANKIKTGLGTRNASVGKIVIETYESASELLSKLPLLLESAVKP